MTDHLQHPVFFYDRELHFLAILMEIHIHRPICRFQDGIEVLSGKFFQIPIVEVYVTELLAGLHKNLETEQVQQR